MPVDKETVPTNTMQAKRLAALFGPDQAWKSPVVLALSIPVANRARRIDARQLEEALRILTVRHTGLRFRLGADGIIDSGQQVSAARSRWPLVVVDVPNLDPEAALSQLLLDMREPFDPFSYPWLRAALLQRADDDVICLAVEHALIDAVAARILLEDLSLVYEELHFRSPTALEHLVSDAGQFARDERAWLGSAKGAAGLEYWDVLGAGLGAFPKLELRAVDGPAVSTTQEWAELVLSEAEMKLLRERAASLRVSPFMTFASATAAALARCSEGRPVGMLFNATRRILPTGIDVVAYLSGKMLLRVDAGVRTPFPELVREVRRRTLESLQHGIMHHAEYLRIRFPHEYLRYPTTPHLNINLIDRRVVGHGGALLGNTLPVPPNQDFRIPPGVRLSIELGDRKGLMRGYYPSGFYDRVNVDDLLREIAYQACKPRNLS